MLTLMITVRNFNKVAARNAVDSLLMELTAQTDITAFRSADSWGQFLYYELSTNLQAHEVSRIAHDILNNFDGDDDGPWYTTGNHLRKLRRHLIIRCYVCEHVTD